MSDRLVKASIGLVAGLLLGCGAGSGAPPGAGVPQPAEVATPEPAPEPARTEREPEPPLPDDTLGTAHPLIVQAAAPDGRWVAACQARQDTDGDGSIRVDTGHHGELFGDQVELFLMTADDPEGERLERFVTHDETGRFAVFVRAGRMILRDMHEASEVDLTAAGTTTRGDDNPTMPDRGAHFDDAGSHLLYLRDVGGTERLVVRDLATGNERRVDHGSGRLWRATFLGDGQWVGAAVIPADTNGNGQLDLPAQQTTLAGGTCRGAPLSYSTYGFRGDAFEWRFLRASDGAQETRDVVAWGSDGIVVRDDAGALRWVLADGTERELVPASCGGEVLALWPEGPAVLVGCGAPGSQAPLRVYDAGGAHDVGQPITLGQRTDWSRGRIVPVGGAQIVDLAQGRAFPRAYAGEQGIVGSSVLETVRGGELRVRDLETGEITRLSEGTDGYVYGRQFGDHAAVRHEQVLVVDIPGARVLGAVPAMPVALDEHGRALVPAAGDMRVPEGPLAWVRPE